MHRPDSWLHSRADSWADSFMRHHVASVHTGSGPRGRSHILLANGCWLDRWLGGWPDSRLAGKLAN